MKKLNYLITALGLLLISSVAEAQTSRNPCYTTGATTTQGILNCIGVGTNTPLPVLSNNAPTGATIVTGNAAGTTGAVVGTLAAAAAKTTFICGFNVNAIGGTAAIGPITVAGLTGSSMVYQGSASAAGGMVASEQFYPCLPASAVNTAITITTTADGTATVVNVNSWGFQQ